MRYLKKFNEDLNATTYKSAGDKFNKIGHTRRGSELLDYANQVELIEKSKRLSEAQNENKEFGLFDITLVRGYGTTAKYIFSGKFYLQMCLESDWFMDQLSDWLYEDMDWHLGIAMEFAIIPSDVSVLEMIERSEDPSIQYFRNNAMWSNDYRYWTNRLFITVFDKGGDVSNKCNGIFDDRDGFSFYFNSRKEAIRFKRLLVDTLEGKSNWGTYREKTIAGQLKSTLGLDDETWRKKWADTNHFSDTCPENPFGEETYNGAVDAIRRMSINGLYRD